MPGVNPRARPTPRRFGLGPAGGGGGRLGLGPTGGGGGRGFECVLGSSDDICASK